MTGCLVTENILFYSDCRMLSKPFRIISLFMLPLCVQMVHAQGESERLLPEGLGFSNHLEYAYDWEKKIEILENWLNLDYRHRIFSAGLRFEVFQRFVVEVDGAGVEVPRAKEVGLVCPEISPRDRGIECR